MTAASLLIPHISHLLAINKDKTVTWDFQRCHVKPAWHGKAWSRLAEIRSPLAFMADESLQMSRSWISWASLWLIGGALTSFVSWPAHPLSHVEWTYPNQVDRIHGYRPLDQLTPLQLLMRLMLDHLVWFCSYLEMTEWDLLAERCLLRHMRYTIVMQGRLSPQGRIALAACWEIWQAVNWTWQRGYSDTKGV